MKKFVLSLAILLIALFFAPVPVVSAQTTNARQYLHLGADPQNSAFQCDPSTGEVVLPNQDMFDPAWGSGSGRKIAGWYPANTAVCRDKVTHVLRAVMLCGNEPSIQHVIDEGKVLTMGVALQPQPPDNPIPQNGNVRQALPVGSSSSINIAIYNEEKDRQQEQPWQPIYTAPKHNHHGLIIGAVIVVGGGTVAIVFATRGHSNSSGKPPGGITGPTF